MFVQLCLALLVLSSLTAASDPECEELLKPLEDQRQVSGKWIFHAGTSDNKQLLEELKSINSSWIEISPLADSDEMALRWGDKANGKCVHGAINYTISGNTSKVIFYYNSTTHEHVGKHLVTCPDCILWIDTSVTEGKDRETIKGRTVYLFTRSGMVNDSHLEDFKKQVVCLGFQLKFHFGETTDLCPDPDAKEEEQ